MQQLILTVDSHRKNRSGDGSTLDEGTAMTAQLRVITGGAATPRSTTPASSTVAPADLPVITVRWVDAAGADISQFDRPHPIAVGGLPVLLLDVRGREFARTTTDQSGNYHFDNVPSGDFTAIFIAPSDVAGSAEEAPPSFWPGDTIVPTAVHTWTGAGPMLRLSGTLR
jgi:hypothetical protein